MCACKTVLISAPCIRRGEAEGRGEQGKQRKGDGFGLVGAEKAGDAAHGLTPVDAGGAAAVFFGQQASAVCTMGALLRLLDGERLAFGKLLDASCGLAELRGQRLRIGDDGQNVAGLGGNFQPPAAHQRLVAGGFYLGNGHLERDCAAGFDDAHSGAGDDQFARAELPRRVDVCG